MNPVRQMVFGGIGQPGPRELVRAGIRWPTPTLLDRPLSALRGVGSHFESLAGQAGIATVGDLLWTIPGDFDEPAPPVSIQSVESGVRSRLTARVESIRARPGRAGNRGRTEAVLKDESGSIRAVWFNRPWVADQLGADEEILVVGRVDGEGFVVESHEVVSREADPTTDSRPGLASGRPRPRHRNIEGIGRGRWSSWVWEACRLAGAAPEPLPAGTRQVAGLPDIATSLKTAHFPSTTEEATLARRRLAFEELFLYQLFVRDAGRRERSALGVAPVLDGGESGYRAWLEGLPWELTGQQSAAIGVIERDLCSEVPMRRLLMGEVGAGKTVVALSAVVRALGSGHQAALMAPTEVLARQHHLKVGQLLEGTGFDAHLLTGRVKGAERDTLLQEIARGGPSLTVGTHALIGEQVEFGSLGLVVVDEEHRFGVRQRSALGSGVDRMGLGSAIHRLHLSATPIPRTLALTVWGDLDLTELRELPRGRGAVETVQSGAGGRDAAIAALHSEVRAGRQGFVVCPVIRDDGPGGKPSVEGEFERLSSGPLVGCRVGRLHGEMSEEARTEAMTGFAEGRIDVLVATTVIEVGIDVPNATVMVIEGAESFGLAQLHQLRGRIGRGEHPSTCFLVQSGEAEAANRRLEALTGTGDGFAIAEADLRIRGEGELAGTRQHGLPRFRVARLPEDQSILEQAREELDRLLLEGEGFDSGLLAPALVEARARFGKAARQ